MGCPICKNEIMVEVKDYLAESALIGKVTVPSISQKHCEKCGEVFLSSDSAQEVHEYVNQKEQEAILNLPIREFVLSSGAAEILGVSSKSLAKNPDVKNGVIITANISGKRLYLKKSLELYRINKDEQLRKMEELNYASTIPPNPVKGSKYVNPETGQIFKFDGIETWTKIHPKTKD